MQETQIQSLIWEGPTCRAATKPVCHYYYRAVYFCGCLLLPPFKRCSSLSEPRGCSCSAPAMVRSELENQRILPPASPSSPVTSPSNLPVEI